MITRDFTEEEFKDIFWEDGGEDFLIVEEGDFIDEGKFSDRTDIVRFIPSGKHYAVTCTRYGNHWEGYEYEWSEMDLVGNEVEKKEVTITQWVAVKGSI